MLCVQLCTTQTFSFSQWEEIVFIVNVLSEAMVGESGFIPVSPLPSEDLRNRSTYYNIL